MATHAQIGILEKNGTIQCIYLHNDGYPEHVAPILLHHYDNEEMARKLIALGDLSSLYAKLEPKPGTFHSFDHRQDNVTVAYHRDRKEPWNNTHPHLCKSKINFIKEYEASFFYLFDTNKQQWTYSKNVRFTKLKEPK